MESRSAVTDRTELKDGRAVLIGPIHANDRERFLSGIGRASPEALYKRFMSPVSRLTSTQIAYLIGVDHRDHEALLAIDEDSGEAVAVGRFVRSEEDPGLAEAAVLVVDDWQGCGLGKAMARALSDRARELGIDRFEATMLVDNRPMLAVLEWLGEIERLGTESGTVKVEIVLPDPAPAERVPGALRAGDEGFELAG
jgi:RimJ/RimL family protein N-acetyltransferase